MEFIRRKIGVNKKCSFPLFSTRRSSILVCFYVSVISLIFQFLVFVVLMYTLEEKRITPDIIDNVCSYNIYEDIRILSSIGYESGFSFILLDKQLINEERRQRKNFTVNCVYCFCKPIVLAVDGSAVANKQTTLLSKLVDEEFVPITFYNSFPLQKIPELSHMETAIFVRRTVTFQIIILYPREDNSWWFGDIHSDPSYEIKLSSLNLTEQNIELMSAEGTIDRFEMVSSSFDKELHLMCPKDVVLYLSDIDHSKFVECNMTRAAEFHNKFGSDKSPEAIRFRHKVWKMLSRVKVVMDSLGIVFWLSSGTVLGYYRECDIIAHSKDVDIGVFATSYTDRIFSEMHNHGFYLKISLGFPNDSLELSFMDQSGIKLDIFFFYEEGDTHYWNGGTQVKSGKKFKYTFPRFTLCWTLFKDLRLRVPCETEAYIQANYGPNWFIPVKTWDWKTSPFNVLPNGQWSSDQLTDAVKMFV